MDAQKELKDAQDLRKSLEQGLHRVNEQGVAKLAELQAQLKAARLEQQQLEIESGRRKNALQEELDKLLHVSDRSIDPASLAC